MMTSQVKERSMLTRRHFVIGSLSPLAFAVPAHAAPHCISDAKLGGQLCKSFISVTDAYQETYYARHEPTAIWIACVAVVFASYGHVIQQPRIAEEAYGGFDNIALEKGFPVTLPLARTWKDDDGATFRATMTPLFDADGGGKFDQSALIQAVAEGDPLILGGGEHPVVLTAVAYAQSNVPNRLVAGFVFDPMPLVGPRALDIDEVVPQSAGGDLRFAVRTKLEKI
jgi:hypothetical protein